MASEKFCFWEKYNTDIPSVVSAAKNTQLAVDGVSGVVRSWMFFRTYPIGRVCCGKCGMWKEMDENNRAWAVRKSDDPDTIVSGALVCEECADALALEQESYRFSVLASEEHLYEIVAKAKRAQEKQWLLKWRRNAKMRREKREFTRMASLVFKKCMPDGPVHYTHMLRMFVETCV